MAFAPEVMAKEANRHANHEGAKPAAPNSFVKHRKFDAEVTRRMKGKSDEVIGVIVTLVRERSCRRSGGS